MVISQDVNQKNKRNKTRSTGTKLLGDGGGDTIINIQVNHFEKLVADIKEIEQMLITGNPEPSQVAPVFKLPERKTTPSPLFAKFQNSAELYRIGNSFQDDLSRGVKNFGFIGLGPKKSVELSMLGLASYINFQEHLKVLVLASIETGSVMAELENEAQHEACAFGGRRYNLSHYMGVTAFDLNELAGVSLIEAEATIRELVKNYDSVIVDADFLLQDKNMPPYLLYIISMCANISLVVEKNISSLKGTQKVNQLIRDFGIELKGVIVK